MTKSLHAKPDRPVELINPERTPRPLYDAKEADLSLALGPICRLNANKYY